MASFEFSIIASGLDPEADDFEARFYDAGCDDATISFQKGHIIVDFDREAESGDVAIASAVKAVEAAGAVVERIEPDPLVSMAEIAARTGLTRAAITNYAKGKRGTLFPAPVARVTSDSPLWDWFGVASWLFAKKKLPKEALLYAAVVKEANVAIERKENVETRLKKRVREFETA